MNHPAHLHHDAARRTAQSAAVRCRRLAAVEIDVSRRVDRGWGVCAGRAG